ncbi:hypothetical protein PPERSA_01305 [Pseudocohnilembus persalinus]|uniref:Uncharacterized protein n=1 Tax=Pseudocohnilembus persalinus TaxID=266149 RepID=A0A0V0QH01_PSEPJ|nr:hypothetical protein PPERSA_01305 [Pseudocohnilembus persalinus]|eukprot:KRX01402.1 hypothetical protein PPERSA_01305 [Pseudocohnilembus persalinus]
MTERVSQLEESFFSQLNQFQDMFEFLNKLDPQNQEENKKKIEEFTNQIADQFQETDKKIHNLEILQQIKNTNINEDQLLSYMNKNNANQDHIRHQSANHLSEIIKKQITFYQQQEQDLEQALLERDEAIQEYNSQKQEIQDLNNQFKDTIMSISQNCFKITSNQ